MAYQYKPVGKPETFEYAGYFYQGEQIVSPFHDIPLWVNKAEGVANMIVEIPKGTQPKLEISKKKFMNPIVQDTKKGKLRYVALKYPFNYGAFPQTWENPTFTDPHTNAKGDNDPLDVVDLSEKAAETGTVKQVKILGTYAMIDDGETDWKIVVIDINDPNAAKLNDIDDIKKVMPDRIKEAFEFLRDYKIPDGKPPNQFAFDGALKDKKFALEVTLDNEKQWTELIAQKSNESISLENTTNSSHHVAAGEAAKRVKLE